MVIGLLLGNMIITFVVAIGLLFPGVYETLKITLIMQLALVFISMIFILLCGRQGKSKGMSSKSITSKSSASSPEEELMKKL